KAMIREWRMWAEALAGNVSELKRPMNKGLIAVAVLLSIFAAADVFARGAPRAAPVVVGEVSERMMAPTVMVAGSVVGRLDAAVAAEMMGRLVWVAEVGDHFEQGEKLAQIDDTQRKLEVEESRAGLAQVKARLTFFEKELKRLRSLAKQNNAARTMLEQTESDRNVARADLTAARVRVKLAQDRVARSVLRAPFSGTVAQRLLQPGEWAESGTEVMRLVNTDLVEVRAMVPLSALKFVKKGAQLRVQVDSDAHHATVRSLVPVGDLQSRLMDLRLDLNGNPRPAGQGGKVAVPTAQAVKALTVHRDAIVLRRSGAYLYRVNAQSSAERVNVTLGVASGDYIQVIGELAVGELVITVGNERMRPGQQVRVKGGAHE
ncbi:MAG TPA: efflux RND transporter periplasmic adaptor subunit, partial [Thermodesulfobacteriaceae bacterium]|nr:efflux RND transporter periplasmic adaptor subunit [Thermodesulfobacteriaceae bacterium]